MNRKRLSALSIAVLAIVFLAYVVRKRTDKEALNAPPFAYRSPMGSALTVASATAPAATQISPVTPSAKLPAEVVTEVYGAPISFFGKVQDQDGAPIGAAIVQFDAIDKFWDAGSKYDVTSDKNGLFSITGIKGAGLTVGVSKAGYGGIKGLSYQSFGYGMPPDSNRKPPPSKNTPAIFVLRKKGETERLFAIRRDVLLPKNGTAVEVNLKTGKPVPAGRGDVKIECWTLDEMTNELGRYEWRARISVPGGGLVQRAAAEFDFVAPESGYLPSIQISMPPASPEWRRDHDAQYWLKLHDQTYARMRLRITTAGEHFASISSYLNPSGSRRLEFDEEKAIK